MVSSSPNIYFITGGAGFVGSVLVRSLVAKKQIVHLLLKSTTDTWRIQDILDKVMVHDVSLLDRVGLQKLLHTIQPTIMYHLAARGAYVKQNDPDELFESNVVATWNLLSASKDIPYHLFVNTGTSSEYGYYDRPMSEIDRLRPTSWYAATKAANSLLALQWTQQQHKPIVHVRLFSVYGPYEERGRLFPTILLKIMKKQPIDLVSPQTARDFIYVDDVVAFYENLEELKGCVGQTLNVGRGEQSTLEEVVKVAFKVTKQKVPTNWEAMAHRPWDTSTWQADMKKTFNLVSWRPTTSLNDGITKMWKWFPAAADIYKD